MYYISMDLITNSDSELSYDDQTNATSESSLHTESDKRSKAQANKTRTQTPNQTPNQTQTYAQTQDQIQDESMLVAQIPIRTSPTKAPTESMPIAHGGSSFYDTDTMLQKLASVERLTQRLLYDGRGLSDSVHETSSEYASEYDTASTERGRPMHGGQATDTEYSDDGKQTTSSGNRNSASSSSSSRNSSTRNRNSSNRDRTSSSNKGTSSSRDHAASSTPRSNSSASSNSNSRNGASASSWASTSSQGRNTDSTRSDDVKRANNSSDRARTTPKGWRDELDPVRNSTPKGWRDEQDPVHPSTSDAHSSDWPQQQGGHDSNQNYWSESDNYFDTPANNRGRARRDEGYSEDYEDSDMFTVSG